MFFTQICLTLLALVLKCGKSESVTKPDDVGKSSFGFCENSFYIPKSRKHCAQGFTFGKRPPKCVCIRGIYRMFLSNCEVADGFAEEVCMLMQEQDVQVRGIKLTKEPNWDKTAAVVEKSGSGNSKDWDYISDGGKAKMSSLSFYTINGEAMISSSGGSSSSGKSKGKSKVQICVQRKEPDDPVCLYKHHDNVDIWQVQKSVDVIVKAHCPKGNWTPLRPRKCFKPLTLLDSECQVPCSKTNIREGGADGVNIDENVDLDKNVTDPRPYIRHDNNYLDRKLNTYLMMQEIGVFNVTPVSTLNHGPNRTFELLEIMKNIVKAYCPGKYVPKNWVEDVLELFHVLHYGDVFKYENELSPDEFKWIKEILSKCSAANVKIKLYSDQAGGENGGSAPCEGVQKANGYCQPGKTPCKEMPVNKIPPPYNDYEIKHYVPEVSWLVLDLVHIICFPQFNESYRMFHLLEQVVEKLFTVQIKNYWYFPSWSPRTKRRMLGSGADDYMHNMEVCAESAYQSHAKAPHRLVRPDPLKYLRRKKRSAESLASSYDVFCAKSKSDWKLPDKCPKGTGDPTPP